jgi:hypothetical protein
MKKKSYAIAKRYRCKTRRFAKWTKWNKRRYHKKARKYGPDWYKTTSAWEIV